MSKAKQISLSEYTESLIEITEIDGKEQGAFLTFLHPPGWEQRTIETCYGDLLVICNTLDDYARLIDQHIKDHLQGTAKAPFWEVHAARLRRISNRYAAKIGYDKAAVLKRCRKARKKGEDNGDVGDDALAQWVKKGAKEKTNDEGKPQAAPSAAGMGGLPPEHSDGVSDQLSLL